jgi:hypothetical protein
MKIALLMLSTTSAYAGVCHPNGGGGNGGGGGSTGVPSAPTHVVYDSDHAYVPRRHVSVDDANKCYEETADINGYRNCTKFGEWATNTRLPHLFIELGMNMRHFGNGLNGGMQSVTHGAETFQYRIVMPQGAHSVDTAVVSDIRGGVGLGHGVYVGIDAELGGLAAPAQAGTEMMSTGTYGSPEITQGRDMMLVMTGIVGVRGTTKHGALGVEAAGGVRSVRYAFDSAYHDCNQTTTIETNKAIVEARARAELWLGPWITAGATVGTSVISQGDWLAGVYLGVHSQAFGGGH